MFLVEESRKLRRILKQGIADSTHRPGNELLRPKIWKEILQKISKVDANLNRGSTNPNESTKAKGN